MATLQQYKNEMSDLERQIAAQSQKQAEYANRYAGFGDELNQALRQRDDTFKTENEDVNAKRSAYYNSLGSFDEQNADKYRNNPEQYMRNLSRYRGNLDMSYNNSQDILNNRKGTINDFMGEFTRAAQNAANSPMQAMQALQQQYGLKEAGYNRAMQENQIAAARASAGRASQAFQANVNGTGLNEDQYKSLQEWRSSPQYSSYMEYIGKNVTDPIKRAELINALDGKNMQFVEEYIKGGGAQPAMGQKLAAPEGLSNYFKRLNNSYQSSLFGVDKTGGQPNVSLGNVAGKFAKFSNPRNWF